MAAAAAAAAAAAPPPPPLSGAKVAVECVLPCCRTGAPPFPPAAVPPALKSCAQTAPGYVEVMAGYVRAAAAASVIAAAATPTAALLS